MSTVTIKSDELLDKIVYKSLTYIKGRLLIDKESGTLGVGRPYSI